MIAIFLDVEVARELLTSEGPRPKENPTSIELVFATWKELSRTHTAWWLALWSRVSLWWKGPERDQILVTDKIS